MWAVIRLFLPPRYTLSVGTVKELAVGSGVEGTEGVDSVGGIREGAALRPRRLVLVALLILRAVGRLEWAVVVEETEESAA